MPRLKKALPRLCLHKASGRAYITIAGVEHYLGPYGSELAIAEYDRIVGEFLASGRDASAVNPGQRVSVERVIKPFWEFASGYYVKNGVPTTEWHAYRQICRVLRRLYGRTLAEDFGPLALKTVRNTWLEQGLARKTINQHVGRVVRVFKWAVAEELVSAPVWQALSAVEGLKKGRTTAVEPKPVPPVDLETIQATMPHLSPVVRDMIRMQLLTGMRPGEVCLLRPIDIDRSRDVWEYRPNSHKTEHHERDRIVYVGPQAIAILGPYLFRDVNAACFSAIESREWFREQRAAARTTPPSCGNARGRKGKRTVRKKKSAVPTTRTPRAHFDTGSYGKAIAYGCKKAWPVPESSQGDAAAAKQWEKDHRWAPNQIRHTRGTEIRNQFGLEAAQVILGHASADVTQIYAERDAEKARNIIRQIG